jgi:hypothetical protein
MRDTFREIRPISWTYIHNAETCSLFQLSTDALGLFSPEYSSFLRNRSFPCTLQRNERSSSKSKKQVVNIAYFAWAAGWGYSAIR